MLKNISSLFTVFAVLFTISLSAQQMNPDAARLYNEGNDKMKAGDYNGAIASFDQALEKEKDYRIYYQKGIALRRANKVQDAIASLNECLKLKPDFDLAYNALGSAYFQLGDYAKAIDNFEKVESLSKNATLKEKVKESLSSSYTKLGSSSMADGNYEKAIEYLTKATALNNYDAAWLYLAQAYNEIANFDKAIEAAENAIKHKSKISTGGPYYYMGLAYRNKGDKAKALEAFNKAKADATYRKNAEYEISLLK
ncbi:MAG: tetratricopeptide repeat protein [Ignavibacteriales bacterium]|nr:hypothetical protein [Ignavibacteriaceae bacterium]MCK6612882.1 tetratricopeptide repeat protein [Ignavibacteriaceae bacterium]QOJ29403.1 MAG: tetratricopeptide repeat protein [Ignavibacteriales bacterium]